ncbi:hypothetical protein Ahy_B10g100813 [Arachis hypogaea]|uniref:Protein FAR1-RELATED SEQUENCE n=1 Tax=Arachis hypogaea TaxID=3818 RepID=A0A444WXS8_ARAHY|nr:hypothetical protein Ahy_B10g100813 [Arachis hypogaea]
MNECDLDNSSETYQFNETSCVVDEKFVPKVRMIFKTLEEAGKFYKHCSKLAGFSTKIRNTTRDGDKIKNQLIVCSREGMRKSKISPTLKTNPSAGLNCPARIYVQIMKDISLWTISKVILNHSHPCCADQAEMLKQHRELSMFVHAFDINWNDFLTKYGLGGNKWLLACPIFGSPDLIFSVWFAELYENRHIWILVYLDHHFWARVRSTQRSESMHSFFNKFITRNSSLRQFMKQYDNCLASKEQAEREFDAADFHIVIPCTTKLAIEAQFSVYIPMRSSGKFKLNSEVK